MTRTLVFALLLALSLPAVALRIEWDPPTTREDGSELDPETDIAAYHLYCVQAEGGPYDVVAYRIPGTSTDGVYEVDAETVFPDDGDWYCALTAEDQYGTESEYGVADEPVEHVPAAPGAPMSVLVFD